MQFDVLKAPSGGVPCSKLSESATVDPVWRASARKRSRRSGNEPLLGGLIHSGLLHHSTLERALAYRFSLKLASGEMSEQILREIADRGL